MAIGLALLAIGTALQFKASVDAADAQEEASEISSAQQRIRDAEALRKQTRQAAVQRARIQQSAEATGTSGSSTETAALSSLSTQVSANVGRVRGQAQTADVLSGLNRDVADARMLSAAGGVIKSTGGQVFSAQGGFDNLFKE